MQTTMEQSFCFKILFFNEQIYVTKDKDRNKKASDPICFSLSLWYLSLTQFSLLVASAFNLFFFLFFFFLLWAFACPCNFGSDIMVSLYFYILLERMGTHFFLFLSKHSSFEDLLGKFWKLSEYIASWFFLSSDLGPQAFLYLVISSMYLPSLFRKDG